MSEQLSKRVPVPRVERESEERCVSFVGIAGAGKSTLGTLLAEKLGWAHVDTDRLLEAYYGMRLQEIMDHAGLEKFLEAEEHLAASLLLNRVVISTGGSVVYSERAVKKLKELGPVVYLRIGLESFEKRVGGAEGRALAIGKKTKAELFAERAPLYAAAADHTIDTDQQTPEACLKDLLAWLETQNIPAREA